MKYEHLLIDIEGTTSPVTFVKEVLFPYAYDRIKDFIRTEAAHHNERVITQISLAEQTLCDEKKISGHYPNLNEVIDAFRKWILEDRKHPALKELQGMIWRKGYEDGTLRSELYPDVLPCLKKWKEKGLHLSVYSSGSAEAQKLFYAHTTEGDLTYLWENWFDTSVGGKKEADSYRVIASELKISPEKILFLSDIEEELTAAHSAGMACLHVVRPGTVPSSIFKTATDFGKITVT